MDSEHPYQPPASDVGGTPNGLAGGGGTTISHGLVDTLKRTRPWVLFMGVMILLGCGLMLLLALFMMAAGALAPGGELGGTAGALTLGIVYVLMALLYLVPAIHLLRYAAAIKRIGTTDTAEEIEQALKHQLAFWRFVGIVTIAVIVLYFLLFVGMIIFAGMLGAQGI